MKACSRHRPEDPPPGTLHAGRSRVFEKARRAPDWEPEWRTEPVSAKDLLCDFGRSFPPL